MTKPKKEAIPTPEEIKKAGEELKKKLDSGDFSLFGGKKKESLKNRIDKLHEKFMKEAKCPACDDTGWLDSTDGVGTPCTCKKAHKEANQDVCHFCGHSVKEHTTGRGDCSHSGCDCNRFEPSTMDKDNKESLKEGRKGDIEITYKGHQLEAKHDFYLSLHGYIDGDKKIDDSGDVPSEVINNLKKMVDSNKESIKGAKMENGQGITDVELSKNQVADKAKEVNKKDFPNLHERIHRLHEKFMKEYKCPHCSGSGEDPNKRNGDCPDCGGSGELDGYEKLNKEAYCPKCGYGIGSQGHQDCCIDQSSNKA